MTRTWSPEQTNFLNWARTGSGSCVLTAVAGAGKSTTILEAARIMQGSCAILAYNKKIAEELKEKLKKAGVDWKKAEAGTVHSFGLRSYRKSFPDAEIDGNKVANICTDVSIIPEKISPYISTVAKLVSLAKQRAIGFNSSIDHDDHWYDIWDHFDILSDEDDEREVPQADIIAAAKNVLKVSNKITSIIDFDDMVYLPLVHRVKFWGYDVVMIDEAQDTNPARRALVGALVKKGGRVIAVGDPAQAIYGFTGADNDALDLIKNDFNAIEMPLTTTFRCPKKVVEFAQQWVSHIHAAETAPEGSVSRINTEELLKRNDLNGQSAILCRNTKPLVELAFAMIRARIPCKVEGRDVALNLKKLATRWKLRTINALEGKLDQYLDRERTKLLAQKKEAQYQNLEDTVETLKVIMDQCRKEGKTEVRDVTNYIDSLFDDNVKGILVLSTIHKSKGREFQTVFWLDKENTCPSRWARQKWQLDQENNLCYVAATRTKDSLILVDV